MLELPQKQLLTGWREAFARACLAMAKEGVRTRRIEPRGRISSTGLVRCPTCGSNSFFAGEELECGKVYETATARFCAVCEFFEVLSENVNYAPHDQKKFLPILKRLATKELDAVDTSSEPCPLCGFATITFHKDLGAIDYYDNYWTVCASPYCDWPGNHFEQFEHGPYADSGPVATWQSDTRRFQSVFISYNSADEDFASALCARLQQRGVAAWFAPNDMRPGQTVREQVRRAVTHQDRLLVVLSTASMASEWVHYEVSEARKRERAERRRILFPIGLVSFSEIAEWVIDDDASPDLARELRKYFIPDFSGWRDQHSFDVAFSRLLEALASD